MSARTIGALLHRLRERWITDRHPRQASPLSLQRRTIYILPTRHGAYFGVLVALLLLGALNYDNDLAFALAFLLIGIGLVAMYHTHRNLLGLRLEALPAKAVFAGAPMRFPLRLTNPSRRPRLGLALAACADRMIHVDVPGRAQILTELVVDGGRRGLLAAPRFSVSTRHPLGLFGAWTWVHLEMDGLIYPAPLASAYRLDSVHPPASDADFNGLRAYRQGDPYRQLAWRQMARHDGEPITKLFEQPASAELWLDYHDLADGDTEIRLARLCRLVLDCEAKGIRYGLRLPSQCIGPALGLRHAEACLKMLALHGLAEGAHHGP